MTIRFLRTAILVAFAAASTYSYAQYETPGRVGRISMTQGQVGITGEIGDETSAGVVNWPVTSRNQITTGRDGRTEIRIGSTAIRLDANSALDVTELDDDSLRLHLHYGSANIRIRSLEAARGFEMSTPQGLVRMQDPGQIRVDSGRRQDMTMVSVFTGAALVEGGGSRLTVRSGRRAEFGQDDFHTGLAARDSFDDWSMLRDMRDDRSESARYVTSEMTGYEELDQHGMWRESSEYGPLWQPRYVPSNWVPYRDGRWTYLQPWGWTWVDNAPWGYAPFHYGRWVMVNQRWCWAPGRNISRVVWSPALVGWVGGSSVSVTFGGGRMPAQGWYPLSPRDSYVPGYRMRDDHLRYVNRYADGRNEHRRRGDYRPDGLTVVPQANFEQRGTVNVGSAPKPTGPIGSMISNLVTQVAQPPVPQGFRQRDGDRRRDNDGRRERQDGVQVGSGFSAPSGTMPAQAGAASQGRRGNRDDDGRRGDGVLAVPAAGVAVAQPASIPGVQRTDGGRRFERDNDVERERRPRGAESFQMQQAQQLQQQQAMQQRRGQLQQEQLQQEQQRQAAAQLMQQQRQQQEQQLRVQQQQAQREEGLRGAAQQAAMRQQQEQQRQMQEQQMRAQQQQQQQLQQAQQREEGLRGLAQQVAMRQQQEQQRQQQEAQRQQQEQQRQQQEQQRQQQRAAQQQAAPAGIQATPDNSRERRRAKEDMRER